MLNNNKKNEYNPKLLSNLLLAAKGPHRTGVEFCQECNISTPTFSRYVNGHNKRPCPVEMLKKVAAHAEPNSNVTYERLIAANGGNESFNYNNKPELTTNEIIGILTTTLLLNKYEFQYPNNLDTIDIMGLKYSPSWSINTTAINGHSQKRWDFIFWKNLANCDTEIERFIRQLLMIIAIVHLNYITFEKLTFVFSNHTLYQIVLNRTATLKLDFCVSFLLIDPINKKMTKEHFIEETKENIPLTSLSANNIFLPSESSLLSIDKENIL